MGVIFFLIAAAIAIPIALTVGVIIIAISMAISAVYFLYCAPSSFRNTIFVSKNIAHFLKPSDWVHGDLKSFRNVTGVKLEKKFSLGGGYSSPAPLTIFLVRNRSYFLAINTVSSIIASVFLIAMFFEPIVKTWVAFGRLGVFEVLGATLLGFAITFGLPFLMFMAGVAAYTFLCFINNRGMSIDDDDFIHIHPFALRQPSGFVGKVFMYAGYIMGVLLFGAALFFVLPLLVYAPMLMNGYLPKPGRGMAALEAELGTH